MPPRVDYVPRPFVRDRYEPDTRTMLQLMQMAAQARAEGIRAKGQNSAQGLYNLGQFLSGSLGNWRQEREQQAMQQAAAQRQAQEDAFKRRDQQLREADLLTRVEEREQARQDRLAADQYKRGTDVAEEVQFGPMSEPQMESVLQGPAAGRARYVFGPGTADGPELQPTQQQQRGIQVEQSINAMGGQIGPNGQVVMPPKPEREPNPTEASLAMLAARGDRMAAQALQTLRSMRAPQTDPALVPIVGPDGKTRYGTREEARGQLVPSSQQKPATGLEKRALNFFNRAQQADTDLEAMEAQIQALGLGGQARLQYAHNLLQSDLGQQYRQAQRAFTEARLRKDSGAAIPEQEYENDAKTYFVQPGDSAETQAQKRRARGAVLASLGFESGQALGEFLGDSAEAASMVQGYRQRAQKPMTVDQKTPVGTLKPGQSVTVGSFTVTLNPPK